MQTLIILTSHIQAWLCIAILKNNSKDNKTYNKGILWDCIQMQQIFTIKRTIWGKRKKYYEMLVCQNLMLGFLNDSQIVNFISPLVMVF